MSTIDVGAAAISRATGIGFGSTVIALDNPANLSGIISSVDVWANIAMTGLMVGTFYFVSGTTYKCRDSATLGSVAAGSKITFSGLAINVVAGDLIGYYLPSAGQIAASSSGGAGCLYLNSTKAINPGDSASYGTYSNYAMSLYGTGVTPSVSGASFLLRMI